MTLSKSNKIFFLIITPFLLSLLCFFILDLAFFVGFYDCLFEGTTLNNNINNFSSNPDFYKVLIAVHIILSPIHGATSLVVFKKKPDVSLFKKPWHFEFGVFIVPIYLCWFWSGPAYEEGIVHNLVKFYDSLFLFYFCLLFPFSVYTMVFFSYFRFRMTSLYFWARNRCF